MRQAVSKVMKDGRSAVTFDLESRKHTHHNVCLFACLLFETNLLLHQDIHYFLTSVSLDLTHGIFEQFHLHNILHRLYLRQFISAES
jgi:hypothetical protein